VPNDAGVRFVLRQGGQEFWIIVVWLTATLVLLQLAKTSQPPSLSAHTARSRELDSLVHSVLEGGALCSEPMGEDQLAGKDPILGMVAPQVTGLDMPSWQSTPPPSGEPGTRDAVDSTASKSAGPRCPSTGAAGDGALVGPRCARPAPTLRRPES
jgi:hypothetical protein